MPLCSPEQLKCVKNIHVDNSGCFKQCSGLLVTSYDQDRFFNLADYMSSKISFRNMIKEYKGFCQYLFQYIVSLSSFLIVGLQHSDIKVKIDKLSTKYWKYKGYYEFPLENKSK